MKRFFRKSIFLPGLVILSLALVRCVRETPDTAPVMSAEAASDFSLFVFPTETRTDNDGMSTQWSAGDRFTLFHKTTGTEGFVLDNAFTVDDPATGHATGGVHMLTGEALDWFAIYPYAGVDAPQAFPVTVGCDSNGEQVQAGYGSMDHLAGDCFPLYGSASNVPVTTVPTVPMRQLASVASIRVTNRDDVPVFIDGLTLESSEALVGSFTLNLQEGTGELVPETGLVSGKAALVVSSPEALAPGASAQFYIGIRPVALAAGSALTLTVAAHNEDGLPATQSKTVTLSQAVTFRAGYIRSLSFGFSGEFETPEEGSYIFSRVTEITPGRRYLLVFPQGDGAVMACSRKGTETLLATTPVTFEGASIKLTSLEDAFTIAEAIKPADGSVIEGYYTIRQENAQFVGVNTTASSRSLVFASGATNNQYWWKYTVSDANFSLTSRNNKVLQLYPDFGVGALNNSAGILPQLYRLVNEEETVEALLNETEYGAYGLPDWIYEPGTMQLSLLSAPGGSLSFRILEPKAKNVTQVAGFPSSMAVDDAFTVDVLRYERGKVKLDKPFAVRVLKVEAPKAWLISPTGAGFIVKYQ